MHGFGTLFADGTGRRLLDFGCGAGIFLELAHGRGFEGYGVDLSPESVAARSASAPAARTRTSGAPLDVPEIAAGGFDVMTLWSVHGAPAAPDRRPARCCAGCWRPAAWC